MSKQCNENLGIYIHIPYCIKKCPYCAFNSFPAPLVPKSYCPSIENEITWTAEALSLQGRKVDTIYFGGGTPSLLGAGEISDMIDKVAAQFSLSDQAEITIEVNPATNSFEKLKNFRKAGINRLSIGAQSFNDDNLKFLGRAHNAKAAQEAFKDARDAGFENISLDLIIGLPGQDEKLLIDELEAASALDVEHVSLYLLTIEDDTPMQEAASRGEFNVSDDEIQENLFLSASKFLGRNGFVRYETSNFAKDGFYSKHNMKYWQGGDYLGIGAGAHSYIGSIGWGMRWWNIKAPEEYLEKLSRAMLPLEGLEILEKKDALAEMVFTSLRTIDGLEDSRLIDRFGTSLSQIVSSEPLMHIKGDLYSLDNNSLTLTDKGALMADEIAAHILQ